MAEEIIDVKAVFKKSVNERLAKHENQWSGEDSVEVVMSVIAILKDNQENPITLTPEEQDVITLASRPTNEVQMRVVKAILAKHKAQLDPVAEGLIKRVVGAGTFKLELVKAGKIKDTTKGGLKDLLG